MEMSDERSKQHAEESATVVYFAKADVLIPSNQLLVQERTIGEGAFGRITEVQEKWSQDRFAMKLVKPVRVSHVYTWLSNNAKHLTALFSIVMFEAYDLCHCGTVDLKSCRSHQPLSISRWLSSTHTRGKDWRFTVFTSNSTSTHPAK